MGHSMGGLIALMAALQNPTLFDGLLLTAPLLHRWGLLSYFGDLHILELVTELCALYFNLFELALPKIIRSSDSDDN